MISFAVTAKLIFAFVFAHANVRFSHDAARVILYFCNEILLTLRRFLLLSWPKNQPCVFSAAVIAQSLRKLAQYIESFSTVKFENFVGKKICSHQENMSVQ